MMKCNVNVHRTPTKDQVDMLKEVAERPIVFDATCLATWLTAPKCVIGPSSIAFRCTHGCRLAMHKICFYIGFMHVLWYHVSIV